MSQQAAVILGPLICFVVIAIDIAAGILGIEAQVAQNKGSYLKVLIYECRQSSYEAYKFGLAATLLLVLAHVIGNLIGGCICVRSRNELDRATPNRLLATASLGLSWITLCIAFFLLLIGTISNYRPRSTCGFAHRHWFVTGGVLCFIHGLSLAAYYVFAKATVAEDKRLNQQTPAV